jgi:hypothetical protein
MNGRNHIDLTRLSKKITVSLALQWLLIVILIIVIINELFTLTPHENVLARIIGLSTVLLTLHQGFSSYRLNLIKQKDETEKTFRELFESFNSRFDKLNGALHAINGTHELSDEQKNVVIDYFNLCAEERFWYKRGKIYEEVWQAWMVGMKEVFNKNQVAKLWEKESQYYSSYYLSEGEKIFFN